MIPLLIIVAETKGDAEVPLEILLDGKPAKEAVRVSSPQLYNLIDTVGDYDWHTLEIRIPDPGLRVFTFTFLSVTRSIATGDLMA